MLIEKNCLFGTNEQDNHRHFPGLAIFDTKEILEKIGEEWKIPEPFGEHKSSVEMFAEYDIKRFQIDCDDIFMKWIEFCDSATQGINISNNIRDKGEIYLDRKSVEYASLFSEALPDESDLQEIASNIRNAFIKLLSPETRNKFNYEEVKEEPSNETRIKIMELIRNIDRLDSINSYYELTQLEESDDDFQNISAILTQREKLEEFSGKEKLI